MSKNPIVFSGIQPTGGFHIGNYIGALSNWTAIQNEYECLYCIVDLHSLTVRTDPKELTQNIRQAAAMFIALGIDPTKSTMYVQSQVPGHTQLSWILSCYTAFGEMSRMTQFKDKSEKNADNINVGLFCYPVLMASDILLFDTSYVPIGDDQRQHLEITRDIAVRFNGIYGDVFIIPEGIYQKVGARIMSLQDPTSKMSKSDPNENSKIMLTDDNDAILRKFKRAITDSGNEICRGKDKEGITNLISILCGMTGKQPQDVEVEFCGKMYGEFKLAVADAVIAVVEPIRTEYQRILSDKTYLDEILTSGRDKATERSEKVMARVNNVMGLNIY
ncbi:MAG: tryptophan--tRNA ligase [Oscillospiraceae bacterium]|nr:tryptophan--tRNA ligase [Oscillospiraceae bacterium]